MIYTSRATKRTRRHIALKGQHELRFAYLPVEVSDGFSRHWLWWEWYEVVHLGWTYAGRSATQILLTASQKRRMGLD